MDLYHLKPTRSRLRLGRGGVVYLVVTALILGAAFYTQANLLFWSLGLMIGGLVVSVTLAWASLRSMTLQRLLPGQGVVGDPLVLRYRIMNRGRLAAFGVLVYETWGRGRRGWKRRGAVASGQLGGRPTGWLLHIGPGQTLQAEAVCVPRRRGELPFEKVVLESGFPFGVVHRVVEFEAPASVLIYPRLHRIHRRLLLSIARIDARGTRQADRGGGGEDFFGLRPYRPGDSTRLIDWKHTASIGEMVVREMTRASLPRVLVQLDLRPHPGDVPAGKQRLDQCEQAISLAASLVSDAYLSGHRVGLEIVGGERFSAHHSLPHRSRMLDALARLDVERLLDGSATAAMREVAWRHERESRPSVIVRPGQGEALPQRRALAVMTRPLVLGSENLSEYVQPGGGAARLLLRRTLPMAARVRRRETMLQRAERFGPPE